MRQTLQLKLSQHLALTPQLQQSIRLLQLSTLELNQEIEQALQENPLLERDEPEGDEGSTLFQASSEMPSSTDSSPEPEGPSERAGEGEEGDLEGWGAELGSGRVRNEDDDTDGGDIQAAATSLRDHLTPALYWDDRSDREPPFLSIRPMKSESGGMRGITTILGYKFDTTGVLGYSDGSRRAFPAWATIPSAKFLAMGRQWHVFFAWLLVINGLIFVTYALISRHATRDLAPTGKDLRGIGKAV